MGYSVSEQITRGLDFTCSNGEIRLTISHNYEEAIAFLDHKDMQRMVSTWLKCVDLELPHAEKAAIEHALKLRSME